MDAAVEVAKYYDFIEVMPPAIYEPLIAKEQIKDQEELQTIIRNLIEVGDRLGKPVLATGNVHYYRAGRRNLSRDYRSESRSREP